MQQLENALKYLEKGFSVIPVKPNKKPYISWEEFQKRRPTKDEVRQWWTKWPNAMIGIPTGSISGIDIMDTDSQEADEELQSYLPDSLVCPTQRTPGGGKHYIFAHAEGIRNSNDRSPFKFHVRGEGGYFIAAPSKNGIGRRYEWLDGLSIEEVPPPPMPDRLYNVLINSLALRECKEQKENTEEEQTKADEGRRKQLILTLGRRDNDLFHYANCLIKSRTPENEVRQVLEILAKNSTPPFSLSEIPIKIDSALKRVERRERNIAQEVREWVEGSSRQFESRQIRSEAEISRREDIHSMNDALRRLVADGIIERCGDKRGVYRRIDREYIKVDLQSASGKPLDMRWPFGIEKLYRPFPKNLITVMGTPDAGKSAFLFNVARMNMDKFKVHYFSSEMGADELWDRLANFGIPKEEWMKKCEMIERSSNFSDVIFPDDLNIIDYLDMTGGEGKEFYKVGEFLEHIYGKLRGGISIIAIQKNYGQDLGRGGLGTIERPRLALAMESSKIKIVKCKNWVDKKFNPNHLELEYKLVDGCKFIIQKDWYKA